jgi:membrane protease YdiL (CAAX protease family)
VQALPADVEWLLSDEHSSAVTGAIWPATDPRSLVGLAMTGSVAAGMYLLGGMQVHGFAISGQALIVSALGWLGANIIVGVAEESMYRGYFLQTLWRSIGFWPASIVIALLFTADHYFYKPGENIWDVISLMSLSLFTCYSVLRTGTLWFAAGFHAAFDYMQFFAIGTPNGEQIPEGRLLDVTFHWPAWLTGGVLGTEASWLMYPAIALGWLYVWWRFRAHREALAVRA